MELLTRDDGVRYLDSLFETIKRDYDIRDLEYMIGEVVDAAERIYQTALDLAKH